MEQERAASGSISLRSVTKHNLRIAALELPLRRLVAVTGPSGAGKTSLVFGVLAEEAERRAAGLSMHLAAAVERSNSGPEIRGLPFAVAVRGELRRRSWLPSALDEAGIARQVQDLLCAAEQACPQCGADVAPQTVSKLLAALEVPPSETGTVQIEIPFSGVLELAQFRAAGFSRIRVDDDELHIEEGEKIVAAAGAVAKQRCSLIIDRVPVQRVRESRLLRESIHLAKKHSSSFVIFRFLRSDGSAAGELRFSEEMLCPACHCHFPRLRPSHLSFRRTQSRCRECLGTGFVHRFDPSKIIAGGAPLLLGGIVPWMRRGLRPAESAIEVLFSAAGIDSGARRADLSERQLELLLFGSAGERRFLLSSPGEYESEGGITESGLCGELRRSYLRSRSSALRRLVEGSLLGDTCDRCHGGRLEPWILERRLGGRLVREHLLSPFESLRRWIGDRDSAAGSADLGASLRFLADLGLGYVPLAQPFLTLSTGERRRLRLARGIVSNVCGLVYLLDEPLGGLFPDDQSRVISVLRALVSQGNTVIAAESSAALPSACDHSIVLGPGGGANGGQLISAGDARSYRGAINLTSRRDAASPPFEFIRFRELTKQNLHRLELAIPLRAFTVVAGPSGSGKSTLVRDLIGPLLAEHLRHVRDGGASPSGACASAASPSAVISGGETLSAVFDASRSSGAIGGRATVASYARVLGPITAFFRSLPGFKVAGVLEQVRFRGTAYLDALRLTVEEAEHLFGNIPPVKRILSRLNALGLSYLRLDQPAQQLSDGELQRIALLRKFPKTLFHEEALPAFLICDEPARGLYGNEVSRLAEFFSGLVRRGHTVVVIEHDPAVLAAADYLIELGPGGGPDGGKVIAAGSPEELKRNESSRVGKLLVRFDERQLA